MGDYTLPPRISVDTKKGMQEIYNDIVTDHNRFRNECIRAMDDGILLVILIEDEEIKTLDEASRWQNPRIKKWERDNALILRAQQSGKMLNHKIQKPPVSSERLVGMMDAMTMKYGVKWEFCHPDETGKKIIEILTSRR